RVKSLTVTGLNPGTTTITAANLIGSTEYYSCTVTVNAPTTTAISLTGADQVYVGKTISLGVNAEPQDAEDKNVTFTSSDSNIATVNQSGVVTGKTSGSATITATLNSNTNITATKTITVTEPMAVKITGNSEIGAGLTTTLTATVTPQGSPQTVTWSSNNKSVATVDGSGEVTGHKGGVAVITAAVPGQEGATDSFAIKVTAYSISLYSNYKDDATKFIYDGGVTTIKKAVNTYAVYQQPANNSKFLLPEGFTCTNYTFTGWNTKADGTGDSYPASTEIDVTNNVVLYAQWTKIQDASTPITISVTYKTPDNENTKRINVSGLLNPDKTVSFQLHSNQEVNFPNNDSTLKGWKVGDISYAFGAICTTNPKVKNGNYSVTAIADYDESNVYAEFFVLKRDKNI
ncbi:MAG: Ig-like domain-containing protein, partial [Clostridiales bacterium]